VHLIKSIFLAKVSPFFDIEPCLCIEVPDWQGLGAIPIKLHACFTLEKFLNPLKTAIIIALNFKPIPGIDFKSLYSFLNSLLRSLSNVFSSFLISFF